MAAAMRSIYTAPTLARRSNLRYSRRSGSSNTRHASRSDQPGDCPNFARKSAGQHTRSVG